MNSEPPEPSANKPSEVASHASPAETSSATPAQQANTRDDVTPETDVSPERPETLAGPSLTTGDGQTSVEAEQETDDRAASSDPPDVEASAGESQTSAVAKEEASDAGGAASAPVPERRRIHVGSRRDKSLGTPKTLKPQIAGADKPIQVDLSPPPQGPVPTPSVRDPLSPELEQQFAAAMGDASLEEILAAGASDAPPATLELESRCKAPVTRIHGDDVFFSLGGRHEGVASLRQFTEPPTLGEELEVVIRAYNAEDGLYEVSIPGASAHVEDWSDLMEGAIVEARITGANTGGLECKVGSIRGFIPSSQIAMFRVEDYAEYLEQKLLCVVAEVNPKRKNLVLSRRAVLEREKEEARKKLLESLQVGQVAEGVVRKIRDFGAFVDLGGVDGLVHISQLSWDRVNHPSEVFQEGQKVRVKIEKVDLQTGKIGLSYRDLLEHPWLNITEKFPIDIVVNGTVSRIAKFGAFVKLAPGVEGLIHISELSHARVPTVGSVVKEGQDVTVKVLSVDEEAQRIALSMKAVLPEPEPEAEDVESGHGTGESADAKPEPAVARRAKPLRGGTDRESGGEQFGLKW